MQTKARRKGAALDLAGREVPEDAGDELLDVGIGTAHEEAHQRRDAAGLVQRSLVLVVLPAVRQVPVPRSNHQVQSSSPIIKSNHQVQSSSPVPFQSVQVLVAPIIKSNHQVQSKFQSSWTLPEGAAGVAVDVGRFAADEGHQRRDAAEEARLLLDGVAVVAQVLQVGRRVGLDDRVRVVQEGDDFVQVRIAPPHACLNKKKNHRIKTPQSIANKPTRCLRRRHATSQPTKRYDLADDHKGCKRNETKRKKKTTARPTGTG